MEKLSIQKTRQTLIHYSNFIDIHDALVLADNFGKSAQL